MKKIFGLSAIFLINISILHAELPPTAIKSVILTCPTKLDSSQLMALSTGAKIQVNSQIKVDGRLAPVTLEYAGGKKTKQLPMKNPEDKKSIEKSVRLNGTSKTKYVNSTYKIICQYNYQTASGKQDFFKIDTYLPEIQVNKMRGK